MLIKRMGRHPLLASFLASAFIDHGHCIAQGSCSEGYFECPAAKTEPYDGLSLNSCCDSADDCMCDFKCDVKQFKPVNGFSVGCMTPIQTSRREDFIKCTTDCLHFKDRIDDCMAYCNFKEDSANMTPILGMILSYLNAIVFLVGGMLGPFLAGYGKFTAIITGCLSGIISLVLASLPQAFHYPLVCGNLGHHAWFGALAFPGMVIGCSAGGFAICSTVTHVLAKLQRPDEERIVSPACAGMMIAGVCGLVIAFVSLGNSCKIGDFGALQIYIVLLAFTFVFYATAYKALIDRCSILDDFIKRISVFLFGAGAFVAVLQTLGFFVFAEALGAEDRRKGTALVVTLLTALLSIVHVTIYVLCFLSLGRCADRLAVQAESETANKSSVPQHLQQNVQPGSDPNDAAARWFADAIYVTKACRFLMCVAMLTSCLFFLGVILATLAISSDEGLDSREGTNNALAMMLTFWGLSCFPNYVTTMFVDYTESPCLETAWFKRETAAAVNSTAAIYGKSLAAASAASATKSNATQEAAAKAGNSWEQTAAYWETPNFNIGGAGAAEAAAPPAAGYGGSGGYGGNGGNAGYDYGGGNYAAGQGNYGGDQGGYQQGNYGGDYGDYAAYPPPGGEPRLRV